MYCNKFSSVETDYTAKGLLYTIQGTILSTREAKVHRKTHNETKEILRKDKSTESYQSIIDSPGGSSGSGSTGQGNGGGGWQVKFEKYWVTDPNNSMVLIEKEKKFVKKGDGEPYELVNTSSTGNKTIDQRRKNSNQGSNQAAGNTSSNQNNNTTQDSKSNN